MGTEPQAADRPEVTIVLPTYNEAGNIARLLHEIHGALRMPHELIVVDDDSPDGTWRIAAEAGVPGTRVERRTGERGLAGAIARGIDLARGDIVVWMDCDFSMPPGKIPALLDAIGAGADIAVGSRYAAGGRDARPFVRAFASVVINCLARRLLGIHVTDLDSGFMAVKKQVFNTVPFKRTGHGEYCIALIYNAHRCGFKVVEAGYECTDRAAGESKTNASLFVFIKHGLQYLGMALGLRFSRPPCAPANRIDRS